MLVQPGHFYDFPADGYLVLSLITEPQTFRDGNQPRAAIHCDQVRLSRIQIESPGFLWQTFSRSGTAGRYNYKPCLSTPSSSRSTTKKRT